MNGSSLARAAACAVLGLSGWTACTAQTSASQVPVVQAPEAEGRFGRVRSRYEPSVVSAPPFSDSSRFDALIRGNTLYLSLSDAIALTLENNLDIEYQRYVPVAAAADVQRTKGGGLPRGLSLQIREGPNGVGGPNAAPPGSGPSYTNLTLPQLGTSTGETNSNVTILEQPTLSSGTPVPVYDTFLTGGLNWLHSNTPQTNAALAGVNNLVGRNFTGNLGVIQGFSLGTQIGTSYNNANQSNNSTRASINPYNNSTLGFTVTQPLLQGFGVALNRRFIRIAENEEKISNLVFRQQIISTVSNMIRIYYDLVSLMSDARVKRQVLQTSQTLLANNRAQVEAGTLAPLEVTRAQAEVARSQQDLSNSESLVAQQEVILKGVLSRAFAIDARLNAVHVVPTDVIDIPAQEPTRPLQDLLAEAFSNRPDLNTARLQIDNTQLSLKGSRNALLPQVNLVGTVQSNALAGQANRLLVPGTTAGTPTGASLAPATSADPNLLGGFGTALSQVFSGTYPTYGLGVVVDIPIRNRTAQADVIRDEVALRQAQVRLRQTQNQTRVEVESALVALQRARSTYDAAVSTTHLQEQVLDADQQRLAVGATTTYQVIQDERDLAQARSAEVAAMSIYAKARTDLERAMGLTLANHNIAFDEAYRGQINAPPAALPPVDANIGPGISPNIAPLSK